MEMVKVVQVVQVVQVVPKMRMSEPTLLDENESSFDHETPWMLHLIFD